MVDMSWFSSLPLRRWSRQRKKKKTTTNGTTHIVSKVVGRIESFMRATERAPHHKYEAPSSQPAERGSSSSIGQQPKKQRKKKKNLLLVVSLSRGVILD